MFSPIFSCRTLFFSLSASLQVPMLWPQIWPCLLGSLPPSFSWISSLSRQFFFYQAFSAAKFCILMFGINQNYPEGHIWNSAKSTCQIYIQEMNHISSRARFARSPDDEKTDHKLLSEGRGGCYKVKSWNLRTAHPQPMLKLMFPYSICRAVIWGMNSKNKKNRPNNYFSGTVRGAWKFSKSTSGNLTQSTCEISTF